MAVSPMKKATFLTQVNRKEQLLKTLQGTQVVELKEFSDTEVGEEFLGENFHFQNENFDRLMDLNKLVKDIEKSLLVLERYAKIKPLSNIKRAQKTLSQLEANFNEEQIRQYVSEILAMDKKLQDHQEERNELSKKEGFLSKWKYLDVIPKEYHLNNAALEIGYINNATLAEFEAALLSATGMLAEKVYTGQKHTYLSVIVLKGKEKEFDALCAKFSFNQVDYSFKELPEVEYKQVQKELGELAKLEDADKREFKKQSKIYHELCFAEEVVHAYIQQEEAKAKLLLEENFFILQGWVPEKEVEIIKKTLNKQFEEGTIYCEFADPTPKEIENDVPTLLDNNALVAPFEMLTEMYSLPKYDEVDPTAAMTPFYMVFFGMMVADVGYGLLMLVGTLIAMTALNLPQGLKRFVRFFFLLSLPTIAWGLIYGSLFGVELPFYLISTSRDVNTILILSVVFGFIQILTALLIGGIQHIRKKEFAQSIQTSFAWQGILIGIALVVIGNMILDNAALGTFGTILAIVSAALVVIIPVITTKGSKGAAIGGGLYDLYGITGYIGDLVSFTRLMALGVAGGSIAAAFNMLVAFMPVGARFSIGIVLIVALHALNMFLALLGAYVHGARLQYVEFFGKFYQGGGRKFVPFKPEEKYVNIDKESLEE